MTVGRCLGAAVAMCISVLSGGWLQAGTVAVVVNSDLKPLIQSGLDQYVNDVKQQGYTVTVRSWSLTSESKPSLLRAYLGSVPGLVGAVFVGDLPVAWYESGTDWNGYAAWPCDLYYMSFAPVWTDSNGNGYFETNSPAAPKIWVSRIKASGMGGVYTGLTEAALVSRYFAKNHAFRTGALRLQNRGLTYKDDDWSSYGGDQGMSYVHTNVTVVSVPAQSVPADLMNNRWKNEYELCYQMIHANPTRLGFGPNGSGSEGSVYSFNIRDGDPKCLFYNMYNCSGCRFTEANILGATYLFAPTYGLTATGTTKTGGMYDPGDYFSRLGQGATHGEAFSGWFGSFASADADNLRWFYGMTLLGDGTLKIGRCMPVVTNVVITPVGGATGDTVWVEDSLPAGAVGAADGGDSWKWIASGPVPFSGSKEHVSNIATGEHQHFFTGAAVKMVVSRGDRLFAYVYLDPANLPAEVMIQWNENGSWDHRAYWGANKIPWGTDGTASKRYMGALPASGRWVRLEVPAAQVGLEGRTVAGMAFTLYGGRATWDCAGKGGSPAAAPAAVSGGAAVTAWPRAKGMTMCFDAADAGLAELSWTGTPGCTYRVQMSTDLRGGFQDVAVDLPAVEPVNVYTVRVGNADACFFRILEATP